MSDEPKFIDQSIPKVVSTSHIVHSFEAMVNRAISAVVTGSKPSKRSVFDVVRSGGILGPIQYVTFLKFTSLRTEKRIINNLMTTFVVEKDADLEAPKQPALVFLKNPRTVELDKSFARILKSSKFPDLVRAAKDDIKLELKTQRDAFNAYVDAYLSGKHA